MKSDGIFTAINGLKARIYHSKSCEYLVIAEASGIGVLIYDRHEQRAVIDPAFGQTDAQAIAWARRRIRSGRMRKLSEIDISSARVGKEVST